MGKRKKLATRKKRGALYTDWKKAESPSEKSSGRGEEEWESIAS